MKAKKPNKKESISLYRNEAFDSGFYQYFKNLNKNKISAVLNNKERNLKFDSVSYQGIE